MPLLGPLKTPGELTKPEWFALFASAHVARSWSLGSGRTGAERSGYRDPHPTPLPSTAEEVLAEMAAQDPETRGLLVKRADGNTAANPMVKIAANAAAEMVSYAGHFGMSPASARICGDHHEKART
jgi:hypothetical protein